jgi:hypothetical protein
MALALYGRDLEGVLDGVPRGQSCGTPRTP